MTEKKAAPPPKKSRLTAGYTPGDGVHIPKKVPGFQPTKVKPTLPKLKFMEKKERK